MNQIPLQDDVEFWHRQMMEHALFLSLLFTDAGLKAQATQLHQLWQQTPPTATAVERPLNELIAYKEMALGRLRRGEWLGWCLPSFIEHVLYEARYFRSRLTPAGTTVTEDVKTWTTVVLGHTVVGPKLVDPTPYAESATPVAIAITELQQRCGVDHSCLYELDRQFQASSTWVRGLPSGTHVVPPSLRDHILRENGRASMVVQHAGA